MVDAPKLILDPGKRVCPKYMATNATTKSMVVIIQRLSGFKAKSSIICKIAASTTDKTIRGKSSILELDRKKFVIIKAAGHAINLKINPVILKPPMY